MAGLGLALWVIAFVRAAGSSGVEPAVVPPAKIDVNTADASMLQVLPSIGPTLSRRIVEDRKANGPYKTSRDLLRVKGITETVLERIRPFLLGLEEHEEAGK
jgi:competence protein ComEA